MPFKALSLHLERVEPLTSAEPWLLVGVSVVVGYAVGKLATRLRLPEVVGYIIGGLVLGPSLTNLLSLETLDNMRLVSDLALALVAFSIGTELTLGLVKRFGTGLFVVILCESFGAFLVVATTVYLLTRNPALSLVLGALASASAPAGTVIVLQEYRAKGPLTSMLLAVVGLDDALGVMIYAFAASIAKMLLERASSFSLIHIVEGPLLEIFGAVALGAAIGTVLAFAVRKVRVGGEMLSVVLGGTLICAGLSNLLHVSLILANLVLGAAVANVSPRSVKKAFRALQNVTAPIYIVFFVLAGAHLQLKLLPSIGVLGLIYILGRSGGKIAGSYIGATVSKMEPTTRKYLGLGILSQAGLAVGLALMAAKQLGNIGTEGADVALIAINTIAATTIVLEIIGPIATKFAITGAGEVGKMQEEQEPQEIS